MTAMLKSCQAKACIHIYIYIERERERQFYRISFCIRFPCFKHHKKDMISLDGVFPSQTEILYWGSQRTWFPQPGSCTLSRPAI